MATMIKQTEDRIPKQAESHFVAGPRTDVDARHKKPIKIVKSMKAYPVIKDKRILRTNTFTLPLVK